VISQKSIQEVLALAQVEEIVGDYVELKKRGVNLLGHCPFHDEKTPSFTVSPTKNIYKCFGCGKAGNGVQFIIEHEGMSFPEAIRHLAQKYNIELEETNVGSVDHARQMEKDSLFIINEFVKDLFINNLMDTQEGKSIGLSYFKERGFRENTIKKFDLGFASATKDHITKLAIKKGFKIELLKELGLTSKYDQDFFRDRVIFPIHNLSGKVIAFGGRTLKSDKKIPKYLNSPESDIYKKSQSLYGIYQAKNGIRKENNCFLVEGYTDVISLHQAGIENVIASSGTSLTEGQIRLIKRYTSNITILYDGDPAGIKAALRGIDLILQQDMNANVVLLPEGEDPDSFVKANGSNKFNNYISEHSRDFIFFKTEFLLKEINNDPIKKTGAIKNIVESIAKIPDTLKRSLYLRECASLLDLSEELLIGELNAALRTHYKVQERNQLRESYKNRKEQSANTEFIKSAPGLNQSKAAFADEHQERDIIRLLLRHGEKKYDNTDKTVAEYVIINIKDIINEFENQDYKKIIDESIHLIESDTPFTDSHFINHNDQKISQLAIHLLTDNFEYASWEDRKMYLQSQKMPDENYINDSLQAIMRLKERKLNKTLKEIEKRIKVAKVDDENYYPLIKTHQEIKNILMEIQKNLRTIVPANH